jgi:hypothetical protein
MKDLSTELRQEMKDLGTELRREMRDLSTDLRHEMVELQSRLTVRLGGMMVVGITVLFTLLKLTG